MKTVQGSILQTRLRAWLHIRLDGEERHRQGYERNWCSWRRWGKERGSRL